MTDDKVNTSLAANTMKALLTNHFKRTILVTPSTNKHYSLPPGTSKVVTYKKKPLARLACLCLRNSTEGKYILDDLKKVPSAKKGRLNFLSPNLESDYFKRSKGRDIHGVSVLGQSVSIPLVMSLRSSFSFYMLLLLIILLSITLQSFLDFTS